MNAGYLVPWDLYSHGEIHNVVPLLCVQQQKGQDRKVRPILDFRWLNRHIKRRPGCAGCPF